MISRVFVFICLLPTVLLLPISVAEAQQPKEIARIGFVSVSGNPNSPGAYVEAFRQGLRDLGYDEGKNVVVEYRYAAIEPERVPAYVAELVQLKVDVLVSSSSGAIRAAKQATKSIPIVMVTALDPVAAGLVDSLARPGGNITGLTRLSRELSGKRLELLKELVPGISRVGILAAQDPPDLKEYESAARALKIPLQYLELRRPNPDLEGAFQAAAKGRVNALITLGSRWINRYRNQVVDLAMRNRLLQCTRQVATWRPAA
jgi:putative ABC transport system substrate-binding protein